MSRSCNVAVIGAGISGLSAARELRREGLRAVVFEKGDRIGGTWVYDPRADSDESGRVHGSLYRSLRTNLPRELMEFLDFPFDRSYGDPRTYPAHGEVLAFLEDFAREFGVVEAVRLRAEVVRVAARGGEWVVEWRREGEQEVAEVFQAVVVCNGHHAEPRLAEIPGIDGWPGKQFHSHNYRIPEPFRDQIVVMIGKGASEYDISIEISKVAKEVHLASRSSKIKVGKLDGHDNIWQHPMIKCAHEDGKVEFDDGSLLIADIIFHCTGYNYCFPFLETNGIVSVDDNRVGPLYKHVFPPHLAPWISFVGLPNKGPIFLMIELQTKWVAQILSGKVSLPPEKDMMSYIDQIYLEMENSGKPKRHTHTLYPKAIEYVNWLAAEVGLPPLEWRKEQTYLAALQCLLSRDDGYRDTWDAKRIQSRL